MVAVTSFVWLRRAKTKLTKKAPCATSISLIKMPAHSPDFYRLIAAGVPKALLEILLLLLVNPALAIACALDGAELFAGVAAVTAGMRAQKLTCIPFEIKLSRHMDMLSTTGFGLALTLILRMGMSGRGLLWMAPVCSSWIFMSMGTTMRSRWTPEGDTSVACVKDGNIMVCRCVLLAALAHALNLTWIIEQPSSSVMVYHPRMQWLAKFACMYWVGGIHMGAYGGDSQKTLKLYSNEQWIEQLYKKLPSEQKFTNNTVTKSYLNSNGEKKVTGGKGLKATQAYPLPFGMAVGRAYVKNLREKASPAPEMTLSAVTKAIASMTDADTWCDAELPAVRAYLSPSMQ